MEYIRRSSKPLVAVLNKSMDQIKKIRRSMEQNEENILIKDNYHLIHRVYVNTYLALLNNDTLPAAPTGKYPRVYESCFHFLDDCGYRITEEIFSDFSESLAKTMQLQNDEIALFPDLLRAAVLVQLSQLSCRPNTKGKLLLLFGCLRFLNQYIFEDIYQTLSCNEALLCEDETYRGLDRKSKDLYRYQIAREALRQGIPEYDLVVRLLAEARTGKTPRQRHIGYYLFRKKKRWYLPATVILPMAASILLFLLCKNIIVSLLAFLPLWQILKYALEFFYSKTTRSQILPRMKITQHCPKTLVTIITLIGKKADVDELVHKMEQYHYGNDTSGIMIGVLADLPQWADPLTEQDIELVRYLKKKTELLNQRFSNVFFAAVRKRTLSPDHVYTGRERKRGAVCDFFEAVAGTGEDRFLLLQGDVRDAKYFVALDSDTNPHAETIRKLVGILEHPLAQPVYNDDCTCVVDGYGIAAPRMEVDLRSANENLFSRIVSGLGGVEVYGNSSFSVYQDLYADGIFAGKGVIRIEAFRKVMKNKFPDNRILSHDILEGSFLRTAYASDICFSDSTPKSMLSYMKRNHRWIRGDIQNLPYLLPTIKTEQGKAKNPLSALSKYKIFDNFRRALTPISILLLLLSSAFWGVVPFCIAITASFIGFLFSIIYKFVDMRYLSSVRYRSKTFPVLTQSFLQCLLDFVCLPYISFVQIDAIIRALWRLISGKKMLEWTTAAESDKKHQGTIGTYFARMWAQFIGIFFLFSPIFWVVAPLWILGIVLVFLLDKTKKVSKFEKKNIKPMLRDMWSYFEDHLTEENHFLPPDNYQQKPLGVVAHRTSPTNIGLAMLCCLGAYDEGFIAREKLYFYLEKALDTIDNLEKWNGHLLNWYDTTTCKPLAPAYVSSVDNGNYAAFLYALKNGLMRFHETRAKEIATRIENQLAHTDFRYLYDKKKNLFYIGYDVERGEYSNSYYDLYASESRLTSFYAIATKQVPMRHWENINRFMVKSHGYIGVKSWSGTMFEYFMPSILLPSLRGSFPYEMLQYAVTEQVHACGRGPWGISESAYYSFDRALNYQYKAFGVRALALRHATYSHDVISPYSTWLTLPFRPRISYQNLMKMKKLGFYGKYGFYEAIDYSLSSSKKEANIVYSYMAHHIGMSFLAGVNYDKDHIMQKRFLSAQMKAYSFLLEEKLPSTIVRYSDEFVQKGHKERYHIRSEEHTVIHPELPNVKVLSNGNFSSVFTDNGCGALKYKDRFLTKFVPDCFQVGFFAVYGEDEMRFPLTAAPYFHPRIQYRTGFDVGEINYLSRGKDLEGRVSVTVCADVDCEIREIAIKNNLGKARNGTLLVYMEPILCELTAYRSHPAFCGLFIETKKEDGVLLFHRRARSNPEESLWLGLAISAPYEFELSRFLALNRFDDVWMDYAFRTSFSNRTDGAVDPCAAFKIPLTLSARGVEFIYVYTACGKTESEVVNRIHSCMSHKYAQLKQGYVNHIKSVYRALGMRKEDLYLHDILVNAVYKKQVRYIPRQYKSRHGIEDLWKYGISGDSNMIFIKADAENIDKTEMFLKAFRLLKLEHIECELIIGYEESSLYDSPLKNRLGELIAENGLTSYLEKRRGIFLVNIRNFSDIALFTSVCCFYADLERGWSVDGKQIRRYFPQKLFSGVPVPIRYLYKTGVGGFVKDGFGIDDKKNFPTMPPWTHILANSRFGTVLGESSLGYTYAYNAQKNKITPWKNDVVSDNDGEPLRLRMGARAYDVLSGASVVYKKGRAEYRTTIGNIELKITVFVPLYDCAKILMVEYDNKGKADSVLVYSPHIVMGNGVSIRCTEKNLRNRALFYTNRLNTEFRDAVTCVFGSDCNADMNGIYRVIRSGDRGQACFVLGYGLSEKAAKNILSKYANFSYCKKQLEKVVLYYDSFQAVTIETADETLNLFYNTFLMYQVVIDRITARTGFYQCSGAYGFRDQLQDAIGVVSVRPNFLKHQILRCAARQFEEGDVMHWWHQGVRSTDDFSGVRTRFSDDLLWLPYAVAEYLEKTGDISLLQHGVNYIQGPLLDESEQERMMTGVRSDCRESVYQHCLRALKKGITSGPNGLVLFGCGDWNDGMSRVGSEGRGETVWGSFFAVIVLERFQKVADAVSDLETSAWCKDQSQRLRHAIEEHAWDGKWYLRGYFDDGRKLGSSDNTECKIDLIAQSFSSIAGGFDPSRVQTALSQANMYLVDGSVGGINLFYPPFAESADDPGYINGYIRGVRENGGQYTHAAVWYALALLKAKRLDECYEMICMLNPVNRTKTLAQVRCYRTEPYVLCGDVYSNAAHCGMGGWSHYTGAAGWYFKVITEEMLGIKRCPDGLLIHPHLPEQIPDYTAKIKVDDTVIDLTVKPSDQAGLTVDGRPCKAIPLDGGFHQAVYRYVKG